MAPSKDIDDAWWFCLKHQRVEHGPGCPDKDRMGPYATEAQAANALEEARARNEAWDAQDDD
ncbi:hypothetical protein [Actinomadura rupiterrae]|uniref:hypothetical protein n=1 Tax=Actinomadura rupiterrae TaxID=559627 RepID=UPI0020A4B002|nr:hypothetical protein [Actinomadura rupiterrae]MCP2338567.1 hypothetical protein [Actinomadura rupiterrae]